MRRSQSSRGPRRRVSPARAILMKKRRQCPIQAQGRKEISYLDLDLISGFIGDDCKIIPSRISGVSARMQRRLTVAIKHARHLALLPYTDQHAAGLPADKQ